MCYLSASAVRADALLASDLQRRDEPGAGLSRIRALAPAGPQASASEA